MHDWTPAQALPSIPIIVRGLVPGAHRIMSTDPLALD